MVERHVYVAVAVNHKADYVVRIAYITLIFRAAERPLFAVNGALADDKIAVAVIESDELHVAVGHQRVVAEHGRIDRSAAETRRNGHEARAYAQAVGSLRTGATYNGYGQREYRFHSFFFLMGEQGGQRELGKPG